jgi:2-polyprenyl-6-hydroxyphenyl methylase/3-demethylubiquinone-9 3-methyltransferase
MTKTTFNQAEVDNFESQADDWWDENGPMKPLHRLASVRMKYLKQRICLHTGCDGDTDLPLKDLKILDIGCGGGLVSEPLARLGATVTGVDAGAKNIETAKAHATKNDLEIDYKNDLVENLVKGKTKYDVVLALEILEHVEDTGLFLESCAHLLKPHGLLIVSTLNRNPKSFMLGIVAAEYLLRWVPRGTHDWKKFLKPSEIAAQLEPLGLKPADITGLVYNPISREFSLSDTDIDVNYFMALHR